MRVPWLNHRVGEIGDVNQCSSGNGGRQQHQQHHVTNLDHLGSPCVNAKFGGFKNQYNSHNAGSVPEFLNLHIILKNMNL
jgi:hypothetical protein